MVTIPTPLGLLRGRARPRRAGLDLKATDGRDILLNSPDGWEIDAP